MSQSVLNNIWFTIIVQSAKEFPSVPFLLKLIMQCVNAVVEVALKNTRNVSATRYQQTRKCTAVHNSPIQVENRR